jgi:hypothetical protein
MNWHHPDLYLLLVPACRSRDVPGYHLRMHPEISQAETAGSRAVTLDHEREDGRYVIASDASAIAAPEEGQAARRAPA